MGTVVQAAFAGAGSLARQAGQPPLDWRRALAADLPIELGRHRLAERTLERGQPLFAQGEACEHAYVALEGWVALEHVLPGGESQIVDFALPGSLIGHQRGRDGAYTVSAQCVTDCSLVVVPRRRLLDLVRGHDGLYDLYEKTIAEDSARVQRRLANVTRRHGVGKVADFISELVDRSAAVASEDDDPLTLPVSQTQLSAALGLTNVYVSRVAKALTKRGLIAWRKRRLQVLDVDGLRSTAASAA